MFVLAGSADNPLVDAHVNRAKLVIQLVLVLGLLAGRVSSAVSQHVTLGMPDGAVAVPGPPPSTSVVQQAEPITLDYGGQQFCPGTLPADYQPPWTWQLLPSGLIYRNYLAGPQESRLAGTFLWQLNGAKQKFDDYTLGGHVGILRYGTVDGPRPAGFQLDIEGAAFPRLDYTNNQDLRSVDFRGGVPLTFANGPFEAKLGYYHLSSHLGDEFLLKNPGFNRLNYVRDSVVLGLAYRFLPAIRLYGEADYAFNTDGGAEPWQFQLGAEYSTLNPTGFRGSPFLAVHGNIRQELNYGGYLSAQAGWQWRGDGPGRLLRVGVNYFNGKSSQYSFFNVYEHLIGIGGWYDY